MGCGSAPAGQACNPSHASLPKVSAARAGPGRRRRSRPAGAGRRSQSAGGEGIDPSRSQRLDLHRPRWQREGTGRDATTEYHCKHRPKCVLPPGPGPPPHSCLTWLVSRTIEQDTQVQPLSVTEDRCCRIAAALGSPSPLLLSRLLSQYSDLTPAQPELPGRAHPSPTATGLFTLSQLRAPYTPHGGRIRRLAAACARCSRGLAAGSTLHTNAAACCFAAAAWMPPAPPRPAMGPPGVQAAAHGALIRASLPPWHAVSCCQNHRHQ
jgi:hypothetical protein